MNTNMWDIKLLIFSFYLFYGGSRDYRRYEKIGFRVRWECGKIFCKRHVNKIFQWTSDDILKYNI